MDKKKSLCFQTSLSELEKAKKVIEDIKKISVKLNDGILPILNNLERQDFLDEVRAYELAISAIETIQELKLWALGL